MFEKVKSPVWKPSNAETVPASAFHRSWKIPSKHALGVDITHYQQTCPACAADVSISHGQDIQCSCGLRMELYGNALTIWR